MKSTSRPIYFTKLELENIRSFGGRQCLDLLDTQSKPARWTLILGDNGVGKTTLLQCLTRMRPVFNRAPDEVLGPIPNPVEPQLSQEEDNAVLASFARAGKDGISWIRADLVDGATLDGSRRLRSRTITTTIEITRSRGQIRKVEPGGSFGGKNAIEPLVLAYGAARHMGMANLERAASLGPTDSLFDSAAELFDAEETLYQLDYLQLKERPHAKTQLASLKTMLAEILPELKSANDIDIRGPRLPGSREEDGGVWVTTPFGAVPIQRLSLGYQTVMAWTADIAWRLLNHYPKSLNPLQEPAIVIVDEIDLHLHPHWQRELRRHLIHHFPAVQFIATAHSPLMAQDALDANLAVIHDHDGEATIVSDPAVVKSWRLDQILTSELFGLPSARAPEIEAKMRRRIELGQKRRLTRAERAELNELHRFAHDLPTAETPADQSAMEIIRRAAALLEQQTPTT
jgi:energy-coupling factor transporter ATP-binding protein EcfA2